MLRRIALTFVISGVLLAPTAHAEQVTASCSGEVGDRDTASCSTTFQLNDPRFISIAGTHAGYETPGGYGVVRLDWTDSRGRLVAEFRCASAGTDAVHAQRLTCWRAGPMADGYHAGTQTLTVTVDGSACLAPPCRFGGAIALSAEGDLI